MVARSRGRHSAPTPRHLSAASVRHVFEDAGPPVGVAWYDDLPHDDLSPGEGLRTGEPFDPAQVRCETCQPRCRPEKPKPGGWRPNYLVVHERGCLWLQLGRIGRVPEYEELVRCGWAPAGLVP